MTVHELSDYHVGVICPLKVELAAMRAMLDEEHGLVDQKDVNDHNVYFAGRIHNHNVVIACLPAGVDGVNTASEVAKDMMRTFNHLRFGLLVGIGGGIPNLDKGIDVRLGDIVVSQPQGTNGGVIQYDKGKNKSDSGWERKGWLNAPPVLLLTALQSLQADHEMNDSQVPSYLSQLAMNWPKMVKLGYVHPGMEKDVFHVQHSCDSSNSRKRKRAIREDRPTSDPHIHYGTIASGNAVVKDATIRDSIRHECGALCVEMEAAGLMNSFPCLVIRGICDYADEHKNDDFHRYAAATAAAFAKELLLYVSEQRINREQPFKEILELIENKSNNAADQILKQDEQLQRQKCHQALHSSTYADYKELNRKAVPGTCQWLLKHTKYQEWYGTKTNDLLWVSADPGCGKSVLSRYLIDVVLRTNDRFDPEVDETVPYTTCYFFFKDNNNQDSLSIALSALLHQLFTSQPRLIKHAMSAYRTYGEGLASEVSQLWLILQSAAKDPDAQPIICVLDGLDECRDPDRRRLIELLCKHYLARSHNSSSTHRYLKFLATSRPYDDIQDAFKRVPSYLPSIRLRGEDENDQIHSEINLVIKDWMIQLTTDLRLSRRNAKRIEDKLYEMPNRTYLWLYLVIDHIKSKFRHSLRPEHEPIIELPRSVDEAYERLLSRVPEGGDRDQVKMILSVIVGARRALSISEMALALEIATVSCAPTSVQAFTINSDRLRENIRQWCGLFVFINHDYIYLFHQTAKEFLLRCSDIPSPVDWIWKQSLQEAQVEQIMARICILFLSLSEFDQDALGCWMNSRSWNKPRWEEISWKPGGQYSKAAAASELGVGEALIVSIVSFFSYAAEQWASHYRVAQKLLPSPKLLYKALELYKCSTLRFRRINVFLDSYGFRGMDDKSHAILLAAYNGHAMVLSWLTDEKPEKCDTQDKATGRTPLILAAQEGHVETVRILLSEGVNTEIEYGRAETALSIASQRGHFSVVQLLLEYRPTPSSQLSAAFMQALRQDHESIIELVLNANMAINLQLECYPLPLSPQTSQRDETLVEILQRRGVTLNGYHGWGTPLHMGVWKQNEHVINMLISKGADVNAKCTMTGSVLRTACVIGNESILQILWQAHAGIDPDTETTVDVDAFLTAVKYCSIGTINKFIKSGTDIYAVGNDGQTALQAACSRGDLQILWLFLDDQVDINFFSNTYGTALFAAAEMGHIEIVKILLAKGADPNIDCGINGAALHVAAEKGNARIVKILLENEAEVDYTCGRYSTALVAACHHGHAKAADILLKWGADPTTESVDYGSALMAAYTNGYMHIVNALYNSGNGTYTVEKIWDPWECNLTELDEIERNVIILLYEMEQGIGDIGEVMEYLQFARDRNLPLIESIILESGVLDGYNEDELRTPESNDMEFWEGFNGSDYDYGCNEYGYWDWFADTYSPPDTMLGDWETNYVLELECWDFLVQESERPLSPDPEDVQSIPESLERQYLEEVFEDSLTDECEYIE